ncbi:MAG: aminotransferase class V-fold PLP-dependent enzyme [Sediminibacterium sp.]
MYDYRSLFILNPDIHFLNFGSFGACPSPIFQSYLNWERQLEWEPVQMMAFDGIGLLSQSREALANYLDVTDKDDLVYVTNPSFAVNLIAKNFPFQAGDEILTTDIEYGACDRIWQMYCRKSGAIYKRQHIPLPVTTADAFEAAFFSGLTPRTKAIFISHITSATGLIFPVEKIVERARSLGLITIVDGAHAPAQVDVSIKKLDPDFYTGACHKWMMAPKGSSFLYVKKSRQEMLQEPLVVSWGYEAVKPSGSKFLDYNQMIGTRDFSAFLTVPASIEFMHQHEWKKVAACCHELALEYAPALHACLGTTPISPLNEEWIGQMVSVPIRTTQPEPLQRLLYEHYKIEIPLMRQGEDIYLRYSIQAFNTRKNLDYLLETLKALKAKGELIQ